MSHELSKDFFTEVRYILTKARHKVAQTVNSAMVKSYWEVGKRIVEEEQGGATHAKHGSGLLKELSKQLTFEFGKGFSYVNLRNFCQFCLTYTNDSNCYALRSNLSWTHHRTIMRVENQAARDYYIEQCEKENWGSRTLERQIQTNTYQRLLSSKK